jgi:hypothetical protein
MLRAPSRLTPSPKDDALINHIDRIEHGFADTVESPIYFYADMPRACSELPQSSPCRW